MTRAWLALIVAPSTALAVQSVMYSLVTPSCASQSRVWMHAAAAVGLGVALLLAVLAASEWSTHRGEPGETLDSDEAHIRSRRRFLAVVGTAVAALSSLVIVSMWMGTWLLSPCAPWP